MPIKLAIIGIKGIPAKYGGFETCVHETSRRFQQNGIEVTVYCRRHLYTSFPKEFEGVKLKYVRCIKTKNLSTISSTFFSVIEILFSSIDVVHIYTVGNSIFIPILKLFNKKCVISVDALDWKRKKWSRLASLFIKFSEIIAVFTANSIIADSEEICKYYQLKYNRIIDYIPFGANLKNTPVNSSILSKYSLIPKKYFLFVGIFRPEKNVDFLIKAFNDANTKDFKLVLLGNDPLNIKYTNYLFSLKTNKIIFLGRKYGNEYEIISQNAYCYVTASEIEGTSPALLAAMGFATAVLVSSIPENIETVGDAGFIFENNNDQSLISQIELLIKNPSTVHTYSNKAFERVKQHYTWDKVAMDMVKIYSKLAIMGFFNKRR